MTVVSKKVQGHSALEASLRILPNMLLGVLTNFVTGYFVNKVSTVYAILITSGLCAVAPLLMAVINPRWPYWYDAFLAQVNMAFDKPVKMQRLTDLSYFLRCR